jgi:hypothetical protein
MERFELILLGHYYSKGYRRDSKDDGRFSDAW